MVHVTEDHSDADALVHGGSEVTLSFTLIRRSLSDYWCPFV